jgi:hypothetical protein
LEPPPTPMSTPCNTDTPSEQTSDGSANLDVMALEIRCLATYIKSIHYRDDFAPWQNRIFDYGITHHSPSLKSGRISRILIYPRSFNPPYYKHFKLLYYRFEKGGRNINIIIK